MMVEQQRLRIRLLLDTWPARWLAVAAWMAMIFFLSAQSQLPSPDDPLINFLFKKAAHFTVFGVLALLFWRALPRGWWAYGVAWGLTVLYAVSDEYHQSFVVLRQPSLRDVVIDACGAATALFITWFIARRARAGRGWERVSPSPKPSPNSPE